MGNSPWGRFTRAQDGQVDAEVIEQLLSGDFSACHPNDCPGLLAMTSRKNTNRATGITPTRSGMNLSSMSASAVGIRR
jgi:hypothetical protein